MSVVDKIEKRLPGYPKGHPDEIRQAAAAFRTLSQGVGSLADDGQKTIAARTAGWQDPAKDAFFAEWAGFRDALDELSGNLVATADKLDKLADEIDDAKRKYDAAIIAVGVTVTVGVAFTFLTAGLSDEAAATAVEAEVSGVAAALETAMSTAAQLLAASSELIGSTATRLIVGFAGNVAAQSFADVVVYPDHNPLSHIDLAAAAAGTAGTVGEAGLVRLFGRLGESAATPAAEDELSLFSRGTARTNADVLANGGDVAQTPEAVAAYARRAGVDLSGVDVHIVGDVEEVRYLDAMQACACTPTEFGGAQIRLGPAAFADEDTLVATIAHEYTHVLQLRAGSELTSATLGTLEAEAYASEGPALTRFRESQP